MKKLFKGDIGELKETIQNLKGLLNKEKAKNKRLVSEIKTLQKAFDQSAVYIDKQLQDKSVTDIVKYFKNKDHGDLEEVKSFNKKMDDLHDRWKCHKCETGVLKLIIIERHDGKHYFRACGNKKCSNRTILKKWHMGVEE